MFGIKQLKCEGSSAHTPCCSATANSRWPWSVEKSGPFSATRTRDIRFKLIMLLRNAFYLLHLFILILLIISLSISFLLAADVLLWKRRRVSFGVIVVATVAWLLFERSGLSFLSICSDVLLILIVLLFLRANFAALRNRYGCPQTILSFLIVAHNLALLPWIVSCVFFLWADSLKHYRS